MDVRCNVWRATIYSPSCSQAMDLGSRDRSDQFAPLRLCESRLLGEVLCPSIAHQEVSCDGRQATV